MRPYAQDLNFNDDRSFEGVEALLDEHIRHFQRSSQSHLSFGSTVVSRKAYIEALKRLREVVKGQNPGQMAQHLAENFVAHEVYGEKGWGDVFITGYFDPVVKGSLKPNEKHFRPIYGVPENSVLIELDQFAESLPRWSAWLEQTSEQKSSGAVARGRLVRTKGVNGPSLRVRPFYSRREIDTLGLLHGQAPVLAYVDPLDSFFIQIQGSGTVELENGQTLRVGYAAQNGHPYVPIGRFLKDEIPLNEMSMQRIEQSLRSKKWTEVESVLDQNPSYVFFTPLKGEPKTSLGTQVFAGRTVATDRTYFPKGALAWLEFEEPKFSPGQEDVTPIGYEKKSRLVMDQDTGGAIRGPGRLDLYFGRGEEARKKAGVMKGRGRLFYLVPKM